MVQPENKRDIAHLSKLVKKSTKGIVSVGLLHRMLAVVNRLEERLDKLERRIQIADEQREPGDL